MTSNTTQWLASGQRGISSNTIFTFLTGINALDNSRHSHPHDPDDLKRCRLLLEQCPQLKNIFDDMKKVSKEWGFLVSDWDELCKTMDEEAPDWRNGKGSAPKTYGMMKDLLRKAQEK